MKRKIICIVSVVVALAIVAGCVTAFVVLRGEKENNLRVKPLSPLSTSKAQLSKEGYSLIKENGRFSLWLNGTTGNFYVENSEDANRWYASPENALEDTYATNICKMDLASMLFIKAYDKTKDTIVTKNSETASLRKHGVKHYAVKDGFRTDYSFPDFEITVPVEVTLADEYLNVRIISNEIKEEKSDKYLLFGLSLLPNFGAPGQESEGYVFVPDGCGALMYLNNGIMQEYSQNLYGKDKTLSLVNKPLNSESATLPVYGIKSGNGAFLSIITKGDTSAMLHAIPNGYTSTYAGAYAEYSMRTYDTFVMDETSIDALEYTVYQQNEFEVGTLEQRYYFLQGDAADYNGMADCYRKYLINEEKIKASRKTGSSLFLDFYAAVRKKQSVAGFLVNKTVVLSPVSDIEDAVSKLCDKTGSTLSARLMSYSSDGLDRQIDTSLKPASGVGSVSQIKLLDSLLKKQGGYLSLGADLVSYANSGNGFSTYSDSVKALSNSPSYQYKYLYSTRMKDPNSGRGYLLDPLCYSELSEALSDNKMLKSVSAFSPYTLTVPYGNYGKTLVTLEDNANANRKLLSELSGYTKLVLDEPAIYALKYADVVVNAPLESTNFDCMNEAVPFYQLVVGKLRPTVSDALNLTNDSEQMLLKALVTGTVPHYTLVTGDTTELIGSSLDELYSCAYGTWESKICDADKAANELSKITGGTAMERYDILQSDVARITYENGVKLIVNFSKTAYENDGVSVEPLSYVKEGE